MADTMEKQQQHRPADIDTAIEAAETASELAFSPNPWTSAEPTDHTTRSSMLQEEQTGEGMEVESETPDMTVPSPRLITLESRDLPASSTEVPESPVLLASSDDQQMPAELHTHPTRSESPEPQASEELPIKTSRFRSPQAETPRFTSSQPETPVAPVSPVLSEDEAHPSVRDSMASIALSDTSLSYDHLSTEQVTDTMMTPRASILRGHSGRMSSVEIMNSAWDRPSRQSTFFDAMQDQPLESPREIVETSAGDVAKQDTPCYSVSNIKAISLPSHSSAISLVQTESSVTEKPSSSATTRRRSGDSSDEIAEVDWQQLDKTEEQEKEDKELPAGAEDESTAFLLARLDQENAKFSTDPQPSLNKDITRAQSDSRPPSLGHLRKLVADRSAPSIRYSLPPDMALPEEPPPMTELEFWAALVQDYPSTASRLPTLTTTKIRSGVPPPLRGVVWSAMAGARDRSLELSYYSLLGEKSPYEGIINKDVGRSFPGVELFRDAEGEGQKMLGRVLKCFSLHDNDIGYCQGLGFLVGPLLMNMGEKEAFCVLVRLMDHYSLRPSFLPSLSGLHMRIFQFSSLLKQHQPQLSDHFTQLGVEPAYLSQWFLSCFAVTCPLPMLFRIYDVIFAEGANETVMRVAMALMKRNEETMLAATEFEEVMQLLLGRGIWDVYACSADELVDDFTALGSIITHARLAELEKEFDDRSSDSVGQSAGFLPDVQAAAGRFLGRLWAPSHASNKSISTLSPQAAEKGSSAPNARTGSLLRRSASKQSISTLNESTGSEGSTSSGSASLASTNPTESDGSDASTTVAVRESQATDALSFKSKPGSMRTVSVSTSHFAPMGISKEEKDMHDQIEDLLTALSETQREHVQMAAMLQREREERGDDHRVVRLLVRKLRKGEAEGDRVNEGKIVADKEKADRRRTLPPPARSMNIEEGDEAEGGGVKLRPKSLLIESQVGKAREELDDLLEKVDERLAPNPRFSASFETKAQLRSTLARTRERLAAADAQSSDLTSRLAIAETSLAAFTSESEDLRSEVKELRVRVNDEFKSRQKLEHTIRELKAENRSHERKARAESSSNEVPTLSRFDSLSSTAGPELWARRGSSTGGSQQGGLRELRLGSRRDSTSSVQSLRLVNVRGQRQTLSQELGSGVGAAVPSPPAKESASPGFFEPVAPAPAPAPAMSSVITPETPAPASAPASGPSGLAVPTAGMWHKRTTSLATKEVFATPQHEVVPEDALLLELVNAKTAEASARQEIDELKRSMNISQRRQDATLAQLRQEIEVTKLEARKAHEDAQAARRAEAEAMVYAGQGFGGSGLSVPTTPAAYDSDNRSLGTNGDMVTPAFEKPLPELYVKKMESATPVKPTGSPGGSGSGGGGVGGWFWSKRTASTTRAAAVAGTAASPVGSASGES